MAERTEHRRVSRVAEALKREISQIALTELRDPRIKMSTVTRVELSQDLRHARVYVSFMGEAIETEGILKGFKNASGYIRRLLKNRLTLRYIPEIIFELDRGAEYGIHLEETLRHLKAAKTGGDT